MWTASPIIGFDTETTGIDSLNDRLVTASAVVVEADAVTKHYWLADPGVEIPDAAARVHGITTEHARANGRPAKEVLGELADLLELHMSQGHAVVAFNASYDLTLLEAELSRHDLPTLAERLGREPGPVVDPYMLDRAKDRFRKGKRKLEDLARHYGVFEEDSFHNAEADVLATLRVLGAMVRKWPEMAEESLDSLMDVQREAYKEWINFLSGRAASAGRSFNEPVGWPVAPVR